MNLHRSLAPTAVRCRSLQVWGWTVRPPRNMSRASGAGASKCGGGQFPNDTTPPQNVVPEPPSVGVDSSHRLRGIREAWGAGASKCGGGQFKFGLDQLLGWVPEPPSVGVDSSRRPTTPGYDVVPEPPSVGVDSS